MKPKCILSLPLDLIGCVICLLRSGVVVVIICIYACFAQRAAAASFHLDLDRPSPQPGDIAERTIKMVIDEHNSGTHGTEDAATNQLTISELKGKEKILAWDPKGDLSKTSLEVNHLISVENLKTNALVKPGTHIIGTSIAGESFFQAQNGTLPEAAYQVLRKIYAIRPRDFDAFPKPHLPQTMKVGEWIKLPSPFTQSNWFGGLGINLTNGMSGTMCLIGTTNLFGQDCFHLQVHVTSTNTPFNPYAIVADHLPAEEKSLVPKYHSQMSLVLDFIEPLDSARKSFHESLFMKWSDSAEMALPDKVWQSHGHFTFQMVSEYRYLGHEPVKDDGRH